MNRKFGKFALFLLIVAALFVTLLACVPYEEVYADPYPILDNPDNQKFKDTTTKDEAIDIVTNGMDNLLTHLNTDTVGDTGYYIGADMVYNTLNTERYRASFVLKLRANLYTYPYENADGSIDEEALKRHNQLIKYNDIILEWYDGTTNAMLIGFYFDGINPTSADPGNNLYLNLQGSKRIFPNFGDSVLYQQIVRLITKFNLDSMLGSMNSDGSEGAIGSLGDLLRLAITDNYKKVLNGDTTSIYFDGVDLSVINDKATKYIHNFFGPFEDKVDPLTNKYLGFKFSTLGRTGINALNSDMQFFTEPNAVLGKDIMTGVVVDLRGTSTVDPDRDDIPSESVDFVSRVGVEYSVRTSSNVVFDKSDYVLYDYGKYEYEGDMFIPPLDLKLDAKIRTDINEKDNTKNRVWSEFRDKANDDLIIGGYYTNELTYLDISGLQNLYGGIKFEDIGLPQAYRGGFDLAELLAWVFDTLDYYIVAMVDYLLSPGDEEDGNFNNLTATIMKNVFSTTKDPDDPSSRNTISIRIDMELIRMVLRETSETGTEYTDEQMIEIINQMFNIDLEAVAAILGLNVKQLMRNLWFYITYDVDEYSIRVDVNMNDELTGKENLILRLDLWPNKIGQAVTIVFPDFSKFKPMQKVLTYSGNMNGQFIFAASEDVDLSELLGVFMGDKSGLNTPYTLPEAADIYFTMYYDQYIREQILENGRWTRAGRSAFNLSFFVMDQDVRTEILRVYANDVGFDTTASVEEFGYIWVDYVCVDGMPRFKVREDIFVKSFYEYMGVDVDDDSEIVLGLTDILQALLKDSWPVFEPDVIRITTSNQTIKDFFRVDELIGTVEAQIGFKQRVKNIDELEANFAMYTVGNFGDISGDSVYSIRLHDTVSVCFDYGNRLVIKNLYFKYLPESIAVRDGERYYYPTFDGLFMGVSRQYRVTVTGGSVGMSSIKSLVDSYLEWEPLQELPDSVLAYYAENMSYRYGANFRFTAYYNRELQYYIVMNDMGYFILYDDRNDAYIVNLGENFKYDKARELLGENAVILPFEYLNEDDAELKYDIVSKTYGYYVVEKLKGESLDYKLLYSRNENFYLAENRESAARAKEALGEEAEVRTLYLGRDDNVRFDMLSGYYVVDFRAENPYILYDIKKDRYLVANEADQEKAQEEDITAVVDGSVDFNAVGWNKNLFNRVDWAFTTYNNIEWGTFSWEDVTLEGGKFRVMVVVGEGMMATYRELITVKVWNRTVDTDRYVNVNTENGKVSAPVADSIRLDPYVYAILKADYVNRGGNLPADFATWFFRYYENTFKFTAVYGTEDDTPDEVGRFDWKFDFVNGQEIYSEEDVSNRVYEGTTDATYVYTDFHGQMIALAVNVVSRTIKEIRFAGEDAPNTYTVDALIRDTYTIPQNPTVIFKETYEDGGETYNYTLNFGDFANSTIFRTAPVLPSSENIGCGVPGALASVINWSNPEANNVKLVNSRDETGNPVDPVRPFKEATTNRTTSFIDLQNYVDYEKKWFGEDWFAKNIIEVIVEMPDKVVDDIVVNLHGTDYTVSRMVVKGGWGTAEQGLYHADPLNEKTWKLPNTITAVFTNADGSFYEADYQVAWFDRNGNVDEDGNLLHLTKEQKAFIVQTRIGNDKVGYLELKLLIDNLSGEAVNASYYGKDGLLAGTEDANGKPDTAHGDIEYKVDTYTRFEIPSKVKVLFLDGTVREYETNWETFPAWVPGTEADVNTVLGKSITENVKLAYMVEDRSILTLEVADYEPAFGNLKIRIGTPNTGRIELTGLTITDGKINGLAPYDFFCALFGNLKLSVSASDWGFANELYVTDAVTSNVGELFVTFDTQKIIATGQELTVFVGQWADADNYTVFLQGTGAREFAAGEGAGSVKLELFDTENTMLYPDGYALRRLSFPLKYADGTEETVTGIEEWTVWAYNEENVCAEMGYAAGDKISLIPREILMSGGYVWLTAMLSDSSRVFVKLEIVGIEIGDGFHSVEGSYFTIHNGLISIADYYRYFPLRETVVLGNLPTVITAQGVQIGNVRWQMNPYADIASITYRGCDRFLLATAMVMGQELSLYMEVKDGMAKSFSYTDEEPNKNLQSDDRIGSTITLNFDAYLHRGYNGVFRLPETLDVKLNGGAVHRFENIIFREDVGGGQRITEIPYDFTNQTLREGVNRLSFRSYLMDQEIYVVVRFYDKTLEYAYIEGWDAEARRGTYGIDPYGDDITVPQEYHLVFREGADWVITPEWRYPDDYEVKYNTFDTILKDRENLSFELTSALESDGVTSQPLQLLVTVYDRLLRVWAMEGDLNQTVSDSLIGDPYNPNSAYHYDDPFLGRKEDLPAALREASPQNGTAADFTNYRDLPIAWNFDDADISAAGTLMEDSYGKRGVIVHGYLKNAEVGQPFTIRVYVDSWTFSAIRKPQGNDWQIMAEDIRFFFSEITGVSSVERYQLVIEALDAMTNAARLMNKIFYPEDVEAPLYTENVTVPVAYPYRLVWDGDALARARQSTDASGRFYLANDRYFIRGDEMIKNRPSETVYYQFEKPNITAIDLGYGFGTNNNAMYVLNPLSPEFGHGDTPNVTTAQAIGIRDQQENRELGEINVYWGKQLPSGRWEIPTFSDTYLKGGVYRGFPVTLELVRDTYTYRQEFYVMLLFLDMMPTEPAATVNKVQYAQGTWMAPTQCSATARREYAIDTYQGVSNPYRDAYTDGAYVENGVTKSPVIDALNKKANEMAESEFSFNITGIVWNTMPKPEEVTQNRTVYSKEFVINNVTYTGNMVRLLIEV